MGEKVQLNPEWEQQGCTGSHNASHQAGDLPASVHTSTPPANLSPFPTWRLGSTVLGPPGTPAHSLLGPLGPQVMCPVVW